VSVNTRHGSLHRAIARFDGSVAATLDIPGTATITRVIIIHIS
jgi:hypothetical protein